jgi:aspartate kinase
MDFHNKISKVSIVGVGMKSHTGIAAQVFTTLASKNINIEMISTSEIKISIIINDNLSTLAIKELHKAFNLNK